MLTEASTRRSAVAVGRAISASWGSILAGKAFTLRAMIGNHRARSWGPLKTVIHCSTGAAARQDGRA